MVLIATQLKRKGYPVHPSDFTVEGNERHVQLVSDSGWHPGHCLHSLLLIVVSVIRTNPYPGRKTLK